MCAMCLWLFILKCTFGNIPFVVVYIKFRNNIIIIYLLKLHSSFITDFKQFKAGYFICTIKTSRYKRRR